MTGSPNLVSQLYANVGTGWIPSEHRACLCEFEYHYRWPQFYDALLARAPVAIEILEERDRFLEHHIAERCDAGVFEYPTRWPQFHDAFLSGDPAVVALLEERDRALETHIAGMKCFGVDYAHGVTCEFDYPTRWRELAPPLLSGDNERIREAVGLLAERDIALETNLTNRVCGNIEVHGLLPDSVTQVYLNVIGAFPTLTGPGGSSYAPGDYTAFPSVDTFAIAAGDPAAADGVLFVSTTNVPIDTAVTLSGFIDSTHQVFSGAGTSTNFRLYRRDLTGGTATFTATRGGNCSGFSQMQYWTLDNRTGHVSPTQTTYSATGLITYDITAPVSMSSQMVWAWVNDPARAGLHGGWVPLRMTDYPGSGAVGAAGYFAAFGQTQTGETTYGVAIVPGSATLEGVVVVDVT